MAHSGRNSGHKELIGWVKRAQAGDAEAFDWLVRRFQDRAVAYAASMVGDLQGAEDAAQEAFVEAYCTFSSLRVPEAFLVWLRKIIWKRCHRQMRGSHLKTVPLETVGESCGLDSDPQSLAEKHELQAEISQAIQSLPAGERAVVTLFYMGQHSHREIAEFLTLPVSTVKSRLHEARSRLKERIILMAEDHFYENRPSKDENFRSRVMTLTHRFSGMIDEGRSIVRSLYDLAAEQTDPVLRDALTGIRVSVEGGAMLSRAMANYPQLFSDSYIQTVAAGEKADLRVALRSLGNPT